MTPCFPYRFVDRTLTPLALLLGAACLLPACIDPKSIGEETDGDDGSSSDTGSGGETDGVTSTTTPGTTTPGTTTQSPTTDPTMGETGEDCPPIDPAPCTECVCIDGSWDCQATGCVQSCEGEVCGEACALCPEDDPDCDFPIDQGVCTATGECVGTPPPKLGFCEGALQPGFESELSVASGCADMLLHARDVADERGLVLWIDLGLVSDATTSGMPVHAELSATDPAVQLEGRAGFNVTANECNDVILPGVDIDESWLPTAGTVIVDVTPDGEWGLATVQLVDVELHRVQPGPAPIVFDYTFSNVMVGWLPG